MNEVKRYECNGSSSIFEDKNGGLVDYGDYAALEAKCAALAAENARLKSAVTQQIELRAEIKRQAGHLTLTSGFSQFAKLRKRLSERLKKPKPQMLSWLKFGRRG